EHERGLAVERGGPDLGMEAEDLAAEDDALAGVAAVIERLAVPGEEAMAQDAYDRAQREEDVGAVAEGEEPAGRVVAELGGVERAAWGWGPTSGTSEGAFMVPRALLTHQRRAGSTA